MLDKSNDSGPAAERLLTVRDLCQRFGVSRVTLNRWQRDPRVGLPRPLALGNVRRWDPTEIAEFERRHKALRNVEGSA